MEVENFAEEIQQKIKAKAEENPSYRKASGVLESLLSAASKIPNFSSEVVSNHKAMAFYIAAGTYKLLKKTM